MNPKNTSLIFIPNITGFTRFVDQTEIIHGQHVISELLEILINANRLGMKVAEIEGDAVLFYLEREVPSIRQLINQAKEMFVNFHNHLQDYEVRRICQCGACSTAHELSLKFIVHQGEIGFTTVQDRTKPYGAAVVRSHKLLKNGIQAPEYILLSEPFGTSLEAENPDRLDFKHGEDTYPDLGKIAYCFAVLTPYRELIAHPKPPAPPPKSKKSWMKKIHINRHVNEVYELLMNLDLRLLWNDGLDKLEYQRTRVNRVGTRYTCLFPVGQAKFQTVAPLPRRTVGSMASKCLTHPLPSNCLFITC